MPKVADAADRQRPPRERQSPRHHREEHARGRPAAHTAGSAGSRLRQRRRRGAGEARGHRDCRGAGPWRASYLFAGDNADLSTSARWGAARETGAAVYFLSVSFTLFLITTLDPA